MTALVLPPGVHAFGAEKQQLLPGPQTFVYETPTDSNLFLRQVLIDYPNPQGKKVRFTLAEEGVSTVTMKPIDIPGFTTPGREGTPRGVDATNAINRWLKPNSRLLLTIFHDNLEYFSVTFLGIRGWRAV